ncbi:MAG: MmgE/PrpD family protein [Chloroflexi bacterium]|nr:MmgE/PrpD family protein [Chloroflexota bacterium]
MEKKLETTSLLAKFILDTGYKDIPKATIEFSKQLILHCVGGCLGGTTVPSSKTIIDFVKTTGGAPEAAVMGAGFKSSAVNAAFVGGFTPHAIEVEDGSWPGAASPITVVPASFALAEKLNLTGKDIIESFVIGFEVQGKMAAACPGGHTKGVSLLAAMGAFGAAAAAARLMKLDLPQTLNTLAITASQAAGLTDASAGFGTHYFQSAASCRNGLTAALFAKAGLNGHPKALEMKHGLLELLCGETGYKPEMITGNLGKPWHVMEIRVKKYPICTLNHRIIDGVLTMVNQHDIKPEQVENIEVGVNSALPRILAYPEPKNQDEAQFSLPYTVTAAVMARKVDMDELTNAKVNDPKRKEFMRKVKTVVHPEWDADVTTTTNPYLAGINPVAIRLKDGREYRKDCAYARGGPEEPLAPEEMVAMYKPLAKLVLPDKDVEKTADMMMNLEKLTDLKELNALLLGKPKK